MSPDLSHAWVHFELLTGDSHDPLQQEILAEAGKRTPVFVRFSTVAGERGSTDTARDTRGFAVKFYTEKGNWDIVGNNTPVFFFRDPLRFPDLNHAIKRDPRTGLRSAELVSLQMSRDIRKISFPIRGTSEQRDHFTFIVRGKGVFLYDRDGREYLDAVGGISVVNVGHGVPEIVAAMREQADKVAFVHGGSFANEAAMALCEELATWAPQGMKHVLLLSGGSEATETAMKLAHQYYLERGKEGKYRIISRWISYHGNTIGALSMSGRTAWRPPSRCPQSPGRPRVARPAC